MGKVKELDQILDEMISAGEQMIKAASSIKEYFSTEDSDSVPTTTEENKNPILSKEEVRKLLVKKTEFKNGKYRSCVKDLVRKYSSNGKLGGIDPENYETLVKELEEIEDG